MCGVHSTNSGRARAAREPLCCKARGRIRAIEFGISGHSCAAHFTATATDPGLSKRIEGSRLPRYTAAAVQLSGYGVGPNTCWADRIR